MKIGYSREDIDFILDHFQELQHGEWPDTDHVESGNRRPGISHRAKFEDPCIVAGEIAARVKLCGQDGLLVELRYAMNGGVQVLEAVVAEKYHMPLYEVCRKINRVKWFCVGKRRSWHKDHAGVYQLMEYKDWLAVNHDTRMIRA
jgi:hypothetical protein